MMYRIIFISLSFVLITTHGRVYGEKSKVSPELQLWKAETVAQEWWLKVDVVRVQGLLRATDATNVFPDGRVYHQGSIEKGYQISTQLLSEFTSEARRKLGYTKKNQNAATILSLRQGSRVLIHGIEFNKKQVKLKLTLKGSWYSEIQTTIRLKLAEGYTIDDVKRSFNIAFAKEEYEIKHADRSDEILGGMSVQEVTKILGYADKKVVLSNRTFLVYDNLKLVFRDDKLVDVK